MTRVRGAWEWLRARPMVVDGLATAVLLAVGLIEVTDEPIPGEVDSDLLGVLLLIVAVVPLAWRRVRPTPVIALVGSAAIVYETLDYQDTPIGAFAVLLALYAVAAYGGRRAALWAAAGTAVALLVVIVANWEPEAGVGEIVGNYMVFGTAWVAGDAIRQRRERIQALEERAMLAERSRDEEASRAVAAERTRIARELHDVVAHSVSVMVVQAGAARSVLRGDAPDPAQAIEALESVERTGRESLNELRRLLGVLRRDDDRSFGRVPQPGMASVDMLVAQTREAGLDVSLVIEGTATPLAPGVDLTAYRIVQEALTNALKHAGPAAHADVHVAYEPNALEVVVSDDGRGADNDRSTGGHGLVGMQERVSLFGGQLHLGNRPGGGYQVRASLPLGPE